MINEADFILMQLEIPIETVKYVCEIAKHKKIILDPAPANIEIMDKTLLQNIYLLKPNETELKILTEISTRTLQDIIAAGRKLLRKGVQNVLASLGGNGSILINKEGYMYYTAKAVDVVDTTAAGDCFVASVVWGLAEGKEIRESIDIANIAAGITASRQGAQKSIPSKEEVDNFNKNLI